MTDIIFSILTVSGLMVFSQLSPGPDVFFVFRVALSQGLRAGVAAGSGISLGFLIQASVACTAGAWVMQQPWSRYMLWAAAAWLLYLAWRIFPKNGFGYDADLQSRGEVCSCRVLFCRGFLCNILNPKCMLFILTLSAGALQAHADCVWYAPALVAALVVSGWLGWGLWSALLQWAPVQGVYRRYTAIIDAVFAVLLAVFALLFLWQ